MAHEKECDMTGTDTLSRKDAPISAEALARIGGGQIAYMKPLKPEEVHRLFPQAPADLPGKLWAMMGADGSPMALADDPNAVVASAIQHELTMVSVH